jgi:hypothetical protein
MYIYWLTELNLQIAGQKKDDIVKGQQEEYPLKLAGAGGDGDDLLPAYSRK